MKFTNFIATILVLLVINTGCKKSANDLYKNPNSPTSTPAYLLFTGIVNDMYDAPYSMKERWGQYYLCNYDYYGNNRYDFGEADMYYSTLINVVNMEKEAVNGSLPTLNPYSALGKFFRAYFFTKMSMQLGDIPMTEALKGINNLTPKYDKQKDVFVQSLAWLEDANADLTKLIAAGDKNLQGDIYFSNDLSKWQKVVNTFRLRLLIQLSKKSGDADLKVGQQFSDILSNPTKYPIMADAGDNLQYVYVSPTNYYPNNPGNFGFDALRYNTSATYISLLTKMKDPRVFVTAEPAQLLLTAGKLPTSVDAFQGADPGEDLGTMYSETNNGKYSLLNRKHYYDTYLGENSIQIGYSEMCFNIAEAINRGWASGDAASYYKKGIQASMDYYSIPASGNLTAYYLHPGASLGTYDSYTIPVDFTTYYGQDSVKYSSNATTALRQILVQKYIALFRSFNAGYA